MKTLAVLIFLLAAWVGGSYLTGLARPTEREREASRARREEIKAARRRCRLRVDEVGR